MKKLISLCALFALTTVMALAADVTGTWKGEANPNGKGGPPTFNLKQAGSTLTGVQTSGRGDVEISNGKVDGDKVSFEVTRDMGDKGKFTSKYSGTVSGTTMKLSVESARGTNEITLTKQ
jgi:opacity protein-like surface antigen